MILSFTILCIHITNTTPLTTPIWQVAHLDVIELEDRKWEAQLREGKPGPSNKRAKISGAFGTEKAAQDVYDANAHEYGMLTSAEQNAETRALNGKQKVG